MTAVGQGGRHRAPPTTAPAGSAAPGGPAPVSPAPAPPAPAPPAPVPVADPRPDPGWRVAAEERLVEQHDDELDRDVRVERRLAWRELGCLLLVAVFVLVRARYLA